MANTAHEQLNAYVRALHSRRKPWNVSVYDMRAQLLGLEPARTEFRFRGAAIEALSQPIALQACGLACASRPFRRCRWST